MRSPEIEPAEIILAGEALKSAGRAITGFALRSKTGGGNPARLKSVWDDHVRGQTSAEVVPVAALPLEVSEMLSATSTALVESLSKLVSEINDKATRYAERRVHETVQAADAQRALAERELSDASMTVDELETKLDEALAATASLTSKLTSAEQAAQAQAVELAQLRGHLEATERAMTTAADQHAAEISSTAANTAIERTVHAQEIEQLRTELATTKAKAEAALTVSQSAQDAAAKEVQAALARVEKVELSRDEAQKIAASAREDAAKTQSLLTASQSAHDAAVKEVRAAVVRAEKAEISRNEAQTIAATAREDAAKELGRANSLETQLNSMLQVLETRKKT